MLLDSLKEEENENHGDDELLKIINEIAFKSASEWTLDRNSSSPKPPSIGKIQKDKLNCKERTSRLLQRPEKEALQCRANSLKRAIHSILSHSEDRPKREKKKNLTLDVENFKMNLSSSSDASPCASPLPVSQNSIMTPSLLNARLTCISPLPDLRRDSMDENFLNTLSIPVPRQFADDGSRRNSGVPPEE